MPACAPQCFLLRPLIVSRSAAQVNERLVYKRSPPHPSTLRACQPHRTRRPSSGGKLIVHLRAHFCFPLGFISCCFLFHLCAGPGSCRDVTSTTVALSGVHTTRTRGSCEVKKKGRKSGLDRDFRWHLPSSLATACVYFQFCAVCVEQFCLFCPPLLSPPHVIGLRRVTVLSFRLSVARLRNCLPASAMWKGRAASFSEGSFQR